MIASLLGAEAFGFLMLIGVIWADEYLDLPHKLFGARATVGRFSEFAVESLITVAVGLTVVARTAKAMRRLTYLKSFAILCGSCQRVYLEGEWIRLEQLVLTRDTVATTHGMCPRCYAEQMTVLYAEDEAKS